MSDTQAAMREFRFLDDKRKGGGLSPVEEQRWIDLGAQLGMTAQQGYVGQDGLWYAYPPGYDPNTGQYYGQQPQYGYAPQPPQYGYDPNQAYYPPQPQQHYDPNTGQYYDPQQAYGYPPQPQAPYQPQQHWQEPAPHPQAPGEWPQNYDPNTGQYYDPQQAYAPPPPSQPAWQPPAPAWQPPAPAYVPPAPAPLPPAPEPVPAAAAEEEGPLEVGEDEVMEVTDDDVTLLDPSPPPESVPAPADPMGDLKSSLSFDEPAAPAPVPAVPAPVVSPIPEPIAAAVADVPDPPPSGPDLSIDVEPEPIAAAPAPVAARPEIPVDLAPEPPPAAPAPVVAAPPPEPEIPVDLAPEPAPAPPAPAVVVPPPEPEIPVDLAPEPPPAPPAPVVVVPPPEPEIPVDLAPEPPPAPPAPAVVVPPPEPEIPVDLAPEPPPAPPAPVAAARIPVPEAPPEVAATPTPMAAAPAPAPAFEPGLEEAAVAPAPPPPAVEVPSIVVADDLGAQTFTGTPRNRNADAPAELPPLAELNAMLGGAPQPPPPPPPSQPDPPPSAPIALTSVAPISATVADLYPQGIPEPVVPPAPPPPRLASFDAEPIPDPRPSIPISISVEEPVTEAALDTEPLLDAIVEPEPPPAPKPIPPPPAPSFAPSLDDLPVNPEPEPLPSTHTGFEASLGDLPPAIANAPPPPIVDVFANPTAPIDTFEATSAPPQVMDFDVAIDDKPVPVEAPLDLSGKADEKIELAKTSDFLDYSQSQPAPAAQPEAASFSADPGENLVESGTLSTFANPAAAPTGAAPIELPPEEPGGAVPLASNADFLGMSELNNTGESWQRQDNAVALEATLAEPEPEPPPAEEEAIIQGVALEEEPIEAEIQAELDVEPEPWAPPSAPAPLLADRSPLAIPPPAAAGPSPYVPPPPKPIPAPPPPAPIAPPAASPAPPLTQTRPGGPVRPAAQPYAPPSKAAPGAPLFETKGGILGGEASAPVINGEHRVILHTVEGQVKRGVIRDTRLGDDTVGLEAQPGAIERIPRPRIKAIFFMLPAGQKAPNPTGDKLRVTFKDGRQLAGFSTDHRQSGIGFFVVPADNRTNTERIFIYRSSVEKVAVD